MTRPKLYTGIYFLLRDGVVVYVGKTTRFPLRLTHHQQQHLPHDAVHFIECSEGMLDAYEQRWIRWFKPEFNKAHKPDERPKVKKVKIQKVFRRMRFRKLSRKSMIGFGSYRETTVGKMIELGHALDLVSMYYKLSHISFLDDVLSELGISKEWQIEKPGVDRDKYFEFANTVHHDAFAYRAEYMAKRRYKRSKIFLAQQAINDQHKSYHQHFNQR